MPRNKIGLKFDGWEETLAKLDEIGGRGAMQRGVEAGLIASKQYVNPLIAKKVANTQLPAKGNYATGDTRKSIDTDLKIEWEGATASIKVGFDFEKSGLKSIFLMYGTPRMAPVKGLKTAIYGSKTQKEIAAIQEEAVNKVIQRIMGE